jgi:uncharacterized protein YdiU (UPF0061 family)
MFKDESMQESTEHRAGCTGGGARVPRIVHSSGYGRLPEHFFVRVDPEPVAKPRLIEFNRALAAELDLDIGDADADVLAAIFSGNVLPPGTEPLAMAYAGHQFGHFVPQLGDGRAILLGEVTDRTGIRRDIQLKGSGRTPFSRNGDGRSALGPVLREYLVSEAMHALGVPGTRALAAVATGETVLRERGLPGAILTRVAASHVRVGTFQYFAVRGDLDAVRRLADFCLERNYPEHRSADDAGPDTAPAARYLGLLRQVTERQAQLVAKWMHVGFIHGVMNTDNMAVSGETIDFGPCAFMDSFDPSAVFSSIDSMGRYAYSNQPHAAGWNLARFAEALLPLIDPKPQRAVELATEVLAGFPARFEALWLAGMRGKLGFTTAEDGDLELVRALLEAMHANEADFTLTFRGLCDEAAGEAGAPGGGARALFTDPQAFDPWAIRWQARLTREPADGRVRAAAMRRVNPRYIPRNHRIEQAIDAAVEQENFTPFGQLLSVLGHPFEDQADLEAFAKPPTPGERVLQTFCGT